MRTFFDVCLMDHTMNSLRHVAEKSLRELSVGWTTPSCGEEKEEEDRMKESRGHMEHKTQEISE